MSRNQEIPESILSTVDRIVSDALNAASSELMTELNHELLVACYKGDADKILDALRSGADINVVSKDSSGNTTTAFHYAATHKDTKVMDVLLKFARDNGLGLNLEVSDVDGNTPLHHAIAHGNDKNAIKLMQSGADVFIPNLSGTTPCKWAQKNNSASVLEYIGSIDRRQLSEIQRLARLAADTTATKESQERNQVTLNYKIDNYKGLLNEGQLKEIVDSAKTQKAQEIEESKKARERFLRPPSPEVRSGEASPASNGEELDRSRD